MWFDSVEKVDALERELESWIGTPFRHRVGVKQLGCDCIHFVVEVYRKLGLPRIGQYKIPDYPMDWHLHKLEDLLMLHIRQFGRFEEVSLEDGAVDGDMLVYKYGRVSSHTAIYCRGWAYQSVIASGVIKVDYNEPNFRKRLVRIFRPL